MSSTFDLSSNIVFAGSVDAVTANRTAEAIMITEEGNRVMLLSEGDMTTASITCKGNSDINGLVGNLTKWELGCWIECLQSLHKEMK